MKRVKRFVQVGKAILELVLRVAPLVGDTLDAIKVVSSLVDKFIEARKNGELKGVDFLTFASKIMDLVVELAPVGLSFFDIMNLLFDYVAKFSDSLKDAELQSTD